MSSALNLFCRIIIWVAGASYDIIGLIYAREKNKTTHREEKKYCFRDEMFTWLWSASFVIISVLSSRFKIEMDVCRVQYDIWNEQELLFYELKQIFFWGTFYSTAVSVCTFAPPAFQHKQSTPRSYMHKNIFFKAKRQGIAQVNTHREKYC